MLNVILCLRSVAKLKLAPDESFWNDVQKSTFILRTFHWARVEMGSNSWTF